MGGIEGREERRGASGWDPLFSLTSLPLFFFRQLKITSAFGAFLDPVADKIMVSTALILMAALVRVWTKKPPCLLCMSPSLSPHPLTSPSFPS